MRLIEKISVILLLFYSFNLARFISNMLGIDIPVEELTWILPCLIIYLRGIIKKQIKFPFFYLYILLTIWFILNESSYFRTGIVSNFDYILGLTKMYTIFVALINIGFGKRQLYFILKTSLLMLIPFIFIFYLIYVGFINVQGVESASDLYGRYNVGNLININGISLLATYAILCILYLKIYFNYFFNKRFVFTSLIIFFLGIIILHATRGAFIISILLLSFYIYKNYRRYNLQIKLIISVSGFITIIFFLITSSNILSNVVVINRIIQEAETTSGREQQIIASWQNFKKNPLFGNGYNNAAYNKRLNTKRSNFHFTQVLSSTGIIWSFLYFYFLYLIFIKNNTKNYLIYIPTFVLITFASYNWSVILILSFISYIGFNLRKITYDKQEKLYLGRR